jgi:putative transposase
MPAKEAIVMRKSSFSEEQVIVILKQAGAGETVAALCRQHGMSDATFYKWRCKYGGLNVSEARRLRGREGENQRLKRLVAEQALDIQVPREVLGKNG